MITGAHAIIYSTNPEADRAFLRDVLTFPHVDVGHRWLIFGLPPAELAVHPGGKNDAHDLQSTIQIVDTAGEQRAIYYCDSSCEVTRCIAPCGSG
jgi:hypothetical protein